MSLLQRARDSGKCAPSLLLSEPQSVDTDGFEQGLLKALDSNGFQLRPEAQAVDDFLPLLQKADGQSIQPASDDLKKSILVHRRCVLLAVVGGSDPISPSVSRLVDGDYLLFVKNWLDDVLSGNVGGVDFLLHLLTNVASLPVTKSVVKKSGMGKLIGSLEKHSMCTDTANAPIIKERIQQVKDNWSSSVKARKSQDQPDKLPSVAAVAAPVDALISEAKPVIPKRASESNQSREMPLKRAKLADETKKASSSFSSLLQKVSGSNSEPKVLPKNDQNGAAKTVSAAQPQPKKPSMRVKWADHFGGSLSKAQILESDDIGDGVPVAAETTSSWSDRKKRDRLREKELLASAKKAKLVDDDDAEDTSIVDRSNHMQVQPTKTWRSPSLLPELPNVTKPELVSNEKSLQESRKASVPASRYLSDNDVPSSPHSLTDVEQALDMTSQSSAVLVTIPFFVPQESTSAPATTVSSSLYQDVATTLQGILPGHLPGQNIYATCPSFAGATPEFLQSLGLPMFLVGQDVQALQTIASSPGLLGTLVDATGQYDQQRLLTLVQTLSSANGKQNHGGPMQTSPYGQPAAVAMYGQPAAIPPTTYGAPASYPAPVASGIHSKSDAGNLHVSGFGPSTTQNDIVQLFSPYLRVEEVFMKGSFCFVNSSDPVNAQIAREALSGTLLGGMPIRINPAQRKTPRENSAYGPSSHAPAAGMAQPAAPTMSHSMMRMPPPPPAHSFSNAPSAPTMQNVDDVRDDRGNPATKNLFVAGYGPSTTEQQLRDLFSQHAEIIGVVSKNAFSFVNTMAREQAVACRQAFMGTPLNGGVLRINFAKESGRLGTSFDLTYGKETGPNARGPPAAYGAPQPAYGAPQLGFGGQPGYGGGGGPNYYGP